MTDEQKTTIHYILAGIFLNGYIQGMKRQEHRGEVINEGIIEIEKILKQKSNGEK